MKAYPKKIRLPEENLRSASGEQENDQNTHVEATDTSIETKDDTLETQETKQQSQENGKEDIMEQYDLTEDLLLHPLTLNSQNTDDDGDEHMDGVNFSTVTNPGDNEECTKDKGDDADKEGQDNEDEADDEDDNDDEDEEDEEDEDDTAMIRSNHYKEYNLKIIARVPKGYKKDPVDLLVNTVAEMFEYEIGLRIHALWVKRCEKG